MLVSASAAAKYQANQANDSVDNTGIPGTNPNGNPCSHIIWLAKEEKREHAACWHTFTAPAPSPKITYLPNLHNGLKSYITQTWTPIPKQTTTLTFRGATLVHRPYDPPTTNSRLREARQAEKEDGSSNEKESRMIAERLEFQTFNNKQGQHCQPSSQGKPCPAAVCRAQLKSAFWHTSLTSC
eukprot:1160745-Pelagomonas_calceolata.AAC.19